MRSHIYTLHRRASHFTFEEFMERRGKASLMTFLIWLAMLVFMFFKYGSGVQ